MSTFAESQWEKKKTCWRNKTTTIQTSIYIYSNILHCQCSLAVTAKEMFSVKEEMESLGSLTVEANTKKGLIEIPEFWNTWV